MLLGAVTTGAHFENAYPPDFIQLQMQWSVSAGAPLDLLPNSEQQGSGLTEPIISSEQCTTHGNQVPNSSRARTDLNLTTPR